MKPTNNPSPIVSDSADSTASFASSPNGLSNYSKRIRTHTRRTHKKSHLGCQTCKKRRIKCDETLPKCGPCTRIKIACSYTDMTPDEVESMIARKNKIDALNRAEEISLQKSKNVRFIEGKDFVQPLLRPISVGLSAPNGLTPSYAHSYDFSPNFGHQTHISIINSQPSMIQPEIAAEWYSPQSLPLLSSSIETNSSALMVAPPLNQPPPLLPSVSMLNPLAFVGTDPIRVTRPLGQHHSPMPVHGSHPNTAVSHQNLSNNTRFLTPTQQFPVSTFSVKKVFPHQSILPTSSPKTPILSSVTTPEMPFELPAKVSPEFNQSEYSLSQLQSRLNTDAYLPSQQKQPFRQLQPLQKPQPPRQPHSDIGIPSQPYSDALLSDQPQEPPQIKQLLQSQLPSQLQSLLQSESQKVLHQNQPLKLELSQAPSHPSFIASASLIQTPQRLDNGTFSLIPLANIPKYSQVTIVEVPTCQDTTRKEPKLTLSRILNSPPPPIVKETSQFASDQMPFLSARFSSDALIRSGFETDMIKRVYSTWTSHNIKMAFSYGFLYHAMNTLQLSFESQYPNSLSPIKVLNNINAEIERERFFATQGFLLEISRARNHNSDALITAALILSWTVLVAEGDNVREYYSVSTRLLGAVLSAYDSSSNTFLTPKALGLFESLFQNIRFFNVRPYKTTFWTELVKKIEDVAPFYVSERTESNNSSQEQSQQRRWQELKKQYNHLRDFVIQVASTISGPDAKRTKPGCEDLSRYSPHFLYKIMRVWICNFPSEALLGVTALNKHGQEDKRAILLFNFYRATTKALDAIFPEVRYLFQTGFVGPVDQTEGDAYNPNLSAYTGYSDFEDPLNPDMAELYTHSIRYCQTMINFFKERLFFWNRFLNKTTHPLQCLDLTLSMIIERRNQFWLTIEETPISEFKTLSDDLSKYLPQEKPSILGSDPDTKSSIDWDNKSSSSTTSALASTDTTPLTAFTSAEVPLQVNSSNYSNSINEPPQNISTKPSEKTPAPNYHIWEVFNMYCKHKLTELEYYVQ
ncbi:hypothetical protein NADFUDRAFT_51772 [Nadsonia fulvescens var. elongata DSM 6958]|uniref:Zn(2)-C6 fungal-type domain-containing protein n=1 Tax=Nadsonia fulvescens var. elongata DSM 6958 TaxID=857566 RepID=A0A1E3PK08_9ASCO|nr:hypothetical protein NADFUDRAFT_51772 [Nadsonia fulvescens var. elongata DSM 6958]